MLTLRWSLSDIYTLSLTPAHHELHHSSSLLQHVSIKCMSLIMTRVLA